MGVLHAKPAVYDPNLSDLTNQYPSTKGCDQLTTSYHKEAHLNKQGANELEAVRSINSATYYRRPWFPGCVKFRRVKAEWDCQAQYPI